MKVIIIPNCEKTPQENIESAMKEIVRMPAFFYNIMLFERYGFSEFLICDNSDTHQIRDYLNANASKIKGLKIRILKVDGRLNSTEIISLCRKYVLENAFFIAPLDVLTDFDVEKMLFNHKENAKVATVCVVEDTISLIDNETLLEKQERKIVNSGYYIFEEEAIDYLQKSEKSFDSSLVRIAEDDELNLYIERACVLRRI